MRAVLVGLLLCVRELAAFRTAHVLRSHRAHRPPMMATGGLTESLMSRLPGEAQTGGAGGQSTYEALLKLDKGWSKLRSGGPLPPRQIVFDEPNAPREEAEYDVAVAGGNIGILLATALALRGVRVAVLEAGQLRGREQDWNASRKEVMELVAAGVITADELAQVIGIEFNPVRCGFPGGHDVWLNDVLNVGVRPERLIALARSRFEAAGGVVLEGSPLASVAVRPGAAVLTTVGGPVLRTRLVVDCMGQRSPIVAQVRGGAPPDGACVVVGSCADGFDADYNCFGDVIYSDTLTQPAGAAGCHTQYFWEAFPASSSPTERTTYMFTYMDLSPERPSVLDIMEDYWRLMPAYQGVELDSLQLRRVLFGLFVSYKNSPLPVAFDRVMQVGDAGGLQSPLSFGGFGAITRHIGRLTHAIEEALAADTAGGHTLRKSALSRINPYQANLRAAWLFQASMRPPTRPGAWPDDFVSKVLVATFDVMEQKGEAVMLPFLQDTLRADGLLLTIGGLMLAKPLVATEILVRLGPLPLADWFFHFAGMLTGSVIGSGPARALTKAAGPSLPVGTRFALNRIVEGWQYGSGLDYVPPDAPSSLDLEALERAKRAAAAARAHKTAAEAGVAAYEEQQMASQSTK